MKTLVKAENGEYLSADLVFTQALSYLKKHALAYSKKKFAVSRIDDIQWILTVPAIWSDKAKGRMRKWAKEAGMIYSGKKAIEDHLIIVYEPDCCVPLSFFSIPYTPSRKNKTRCFHRRPNRAKQRKDDARCPGR